MDIVTTVVADLLQAAATTHNAVVMLWLSPLEAVAEAVTNPPGLYRAVVVPPRLFLALMRDVAFDVVEDAAKWTGLPAPWPPRPIPLPMFLLIAAGVLLVGVSP